MEPTIASWKRVLLTGASVGAGFALTAILIVGGYIWHSRRPKPPKPWNTSAITASFDHLDTEDRQNTFVFLYTLQNNTDFDYRLTKESAILSVAFKTQESIQVVTDPKVLTADFPVFIPARQRVRFTVHLLEYRYSDKESLTDEATSEARKKYRDALAAHLRKYMDNLNGFVIYDESDRYQINLSRSW